jgi:hypothetical protein
MYSTTSIWLSDIGYVRCAGRTMIVTSMQQEIFWRLGKPWLPFSFFIEKS